MPGNPFGRGLCRGRQNILIQESQECVLLPSACFVMQVVNSYVDRLACWFIGQRWPMDEALKLEIGEVDWKMKIWTD